MYTFGGVGECAGVGAGVGPKCTLKAEILGCLKFGGLKYFVSEISVLGKITRKHFYTPPPPQRPHWAPKNTGGGANYGIMPFQRGLKPP